MAIERRIQPGRGYSRALEACALRLMKTLGWRRKQKEHVFIIASVSMERAKRIKLMDPI